MREFGTTSPLAAPIYLFILAGCMTGLAAEPPVMAPTTHSLTVTQKEDGGEIVLAAGGTLILRLEAIQGTGYGWQIVKDASPQLKTVGSPESEASGNTKEGGMEIEVFQFTAHVPGSSDLELQYRRPWEKQIAPAKTYRLRVIVH